MEHVPQTVIIRLAAGELDGTRKGKVERHIEQCAICRDIFQKQAAAWQAMGEWSPQPAEADLFAAIEDRLGTSAPARQTFWANVGRASRVAAAIAIGVGAGYTAARTSGPPVEATTPVSAEAAQDDALAALRIEHFENYAPAGLLSAWQDMITSEQAEDLP